MGPALTPARRCRPLFGRVRRRGRYPSTCQRQKVEWSLRVTIGTSFIRSVDMPTLALELPAGKSFFIRIVVSGARRVLSTPCLSMSTTAPAASGG